MYYKVILCLINAISNILTQISFFTSFRLKDPFRTKKFKSVGYFSVRDRDTGIERDRDTEIERGRDTEKESEDRDWKVERQREKETKLKSNKQQEIFLKENEKERKRERKIKIEKERGETVGGMKRKGGKDQTKEKNRTRFKRVVYIYFRKRERHFTLRELNLVMI